jgi:hypothetical protein
VLLPSPERALTDERGHSGERAGFTREGGLRDYRENRGVWRDYEMSSLLCSEL